MDAVSIFIDINKLIIDINKLIIDINKLIIDINKDGVGHITKRMLPVKERAMHA